MILAVTSDGDYLAAILKSRWNSEAFIEFLKMINWWIDAYNINGEKSTGIPGQLFYSSE